MAMNIFRMTGDLSHMLSILLLLKLVFVQKDGRGLSFRSQELFLLLFLTRYLDLFTTFYSLYNSCVKVLYISSTAALLIRLQKKNPDGGSCMHDKARDVFPHVTYLVLPSLVLALVNHYIGSGWGKYFDWMELLWTFSIWLESVAIIPQLVLLQKYRKIQPVLAHAILFMGLYRALYVLNWIYRSHNEMGYQHHWGVYIAGAVQVLLYADFFYSYYVAKCRTTTTTNSSNNNGNGNGSADDIEEGEETQRSSSSDGHHQLTYNPIMQNKLCCCNHVAKDEEETEPDETALWDDDTSNQSHAPAKNASNSSSTPPPMFIFMGSPLGVLCRLLIAVGTMIALFTSPDRGSFVPMEELFFSGLVVAAVWMLGSYLLRRRAPATTTTADDQSETTPGSDLKTPLLQSNTTTTTPGVHDSDDDAVVSDSQQANLAVAVPALAEGATEAEMH